jgi:hypothetical protein
MGHCCAGLVVLAEVSDGQGGGQQRASEEARAEEARLTAKEAL